MEQNIGLGWAWFDRQRARLAGIAAVLAFIPGCQALSALLGAAIALTAKYTSTEARGTVNTDYDPTPAETLIIDNFMTNKFGPWFKTIGLEYATAFEKSNVSKEQKIIVANSILNKIEAVDTYFQTKETKGLSTGAVAVRLRLMGIFFDTITETMVKETGSVSMAFAQATITSITGFSEIITTPAVFIGMSYLKPRLVFLGGGKDPIKIIPPNGEWENPIDFPIDPKEDPKVDPKVDPKPSDLETSKAGKYIAIAAGVGIVLYLLTSSKKNNNN